MVIFGSAFLDGILGAVLGAVVGSYLATLLTRARLPAEELANPRSRCDGCARRLGWYELVPVVAFFIQRGLCRHCSAPIDRAHPVIELACGALGSACFAAGLPALAPLTWLAVALAAFDARYLWLPNALVAFLAASATIAPAWSAEMSWPQRALGGLLGFVALWLIAQLFRAIRGRAGLGGGDPKLFGAIGLWVGAGGLPLTMLIACAMGLMHAAIRLRRGAIAQTVQLPLGTYLSLATLILVVLKIFGAFGVLLA